MATPETLTGGAMENSLRLSTVLCVVCWREWPHSGDEFVFQGLVLASSSVGDFNTP